MSEITIREIEENDLEKGFLESLDFLRSVLPVVDFIMGSITIGTL